MTNCHAILTVSGSPSMASRLLPVISAVVGGFVCFAGSGTCFAQEVLRIHDNVEVGYFPQWTDSHSDMNGDGVREYLWAAQGLHPLGGLSGVAMLDGASGDRLWFTEHDLEFTQTRGIASIDDVDGDGLRDVAVIALHSFLGGRCTLLSGASGASIGWFEPSAASNAAFRGVWGLGDVDGDGVSDLLVQWTDFTHRVVSGASPYPVLYEVPGSSGYAERATRLDDVDGDGVDDFAVRYGFFAVSPVNVHSAATGAILYTIPFGLGLASIDDVDGDGIGDFCMTGGLPAFLLGRQHSVVSVLSGADGEMVWERPSPAPESSFGFHVGAGGDVNGDGSADVVVVESAPPYSNRVIMRVLDGRTGAVLRDIDRADGTPQGGCPPFFFESVRILGDLDGDGYAEFAGADPDYIECGTLPAIDRGRLYIFKGGPGGEVESVCGGTSTSTNTAAVLRAAGAAQVGSEHFALQLYDAPTHEFTQLAFGAELGPGAPFSPLGAGYLCLDPSGAQRVGAPRSTGPAGGTWFFPGWTQDPAVAASWSAGTSWVVQAIFRDRADPMGVNTSSAIRVSFF